MSRLLRTALLLAVLAGMLTAAPAAARAPRAKAQKADLAAAVTTVHYVPTVQDAVIRVEVTRHTELDQQGQGVLLTYSPYNVLGDPTSSGTVSGSSPYLSMGIARAHADVLGTRGSTGCWDYGGKDEQQSGVDVVRFLAGETPDVDGKFLDWSNGNVGMTGGSYDGTTATMVAATGLPALKAIEPIAAISHWYGYAYYDGVRYFLNSEAATDEGFDTPLAFDHGIGDTFHTDNPDSITARAGSSTNHRPTAATPTTPTSGRSVTTRSRPRSGAQRRSSATAGTTTTSSRTRPSGCSPRCSPTPTTAPRPSARVPTSCCGCPRAPTGPPRRRTTRS
jgi:hypothetical protein